MFEWSLRYESTGRCISISDLRHAVAPLEPCNPGASLTTPLPYACAAGHDSLRSPGPCSALLPGDGVPFPNLRPGMVKSDRVRE
jgi:hypothetical protein